MEIIKMSSKSGKTNYYGINFTTKTVKVQSRTKAIDILLYFNTEANLELIEGNRCFFLYIDDQSCGRISKKDFNFLKGIQNVESYTLSRSSALRDCDSNVREGHQKNNPSTREKSEGTQIQFGCRVFNPYSDGASDFTCTVEWRGIHLHTETNRNLGLVRIPKNNFTEFNLGSETTKCLVLSLSELSRTQYNFEQRITNIRKRQQETSRRQQETSRRQQETSRRQQETSRRQQETSRILEETSRILLEAEEIAEQIDRIAEEYHSRIR